jgi:hypothetical protein
MKRRGRSTDARQCSSVKSSGEFVHVGVRFPEGRSGFTGLYVAAQGGGIYDLHASAKLGERQLQSGKWPECSNWWNNRGRVANVSQMESFENRTFLPASVRESQ